MGDSNVFTSNIRLSRQRCTEFKILMWMHNSLANCFPSYLGHLCIICNCHPYVEADFIALQHKGILIVFSHSVQFHNAEWKALLQAFYNLQWNRVQENIWHELSSSVLASILQVGDDHSINHGLALQCWDKHRGDFLNRSHINMHSQMHKQRLPNCVSLLPNVTSSYISISWNTSLLCMSSKRVKIAPWAKYPIWEQLAEHWLRL